MDSKQIDPELLDTLRGEPTSWARRVREWAEENIPGAYSWFFRYDAADWLHPSRLLRKARNVLRWLPVIWDDVDWDYSSLYRMIHVKLGNMRRSHEENHHHVDWEETVDQLRAAEGCMDRLVKDDYGMAEYEEHGKRFPRNREFVKGPDGMYHSEPMSEEAVEDFRRLTKKEDEDRQRDLDTFAELFVKHSRGWWE